MKQIKQKREEFIDPSLFGNDAGEDENIQRLNDYYLLKPEHERFFQAKNKLQIVRARKGIGKSALLCYTANKIQEENPDSIVINIKASELISQFKSSPENTLEQVNFWQQLICTRINKELGRYIKLPSSSDNMLLIDCSELSNLRGQNIITSLIERFKVVFSDSSLNYEKSKINDNYSFLTRYSKKNYNQVWLFVDDIDATFINNHKNRIFVSTFFSACRTLINTVDGLIIRASIRTDVWSLISTDEALDKCEQYMLNLSWSTKDTGIILYKKILSYYKENNNSIYSSIQESSNFRETFNIIFNKTFKWGTSQVEPYRVIHILSAGRPRWAAQLCKIAANDAYSKCHSKIAMGNINFAMDKYGKSRLSDLYKEHNHQCNSLENIIESFRNGKKEFRSTDLITHIEDKITQHKTMPVLIDNNSISDPLFVAKFLYRIGFITLRNDEFNKAAGFTRFEDSPNLLISSNLRENDLWIIHPAYRTALNLHE